MQVAPIKASAISRRCERKKDYIKLIAFDVILSSIRMTSASQSIRVLLKMLSSRLSRIP